MSGSAFARGEDLVVWREHLPHLNGEVQVALEGQIGLKFAGHRDPHESTIASRLLPSGREETSVLRLRRAWDGPGVFVELVSTRPDAPQPLWEALHARVLRLVGEVERVTAAQDENSLVPMSESASALNVGQGRDAVGEADFIRAAEVVVSLAQTDVKSAERYVAVTVASLRDEASRRMAGLSPHGEQLMDVDRRIRELRLRLRFHPSTRAATALVSWSGSVIPNLGIVISGLLLLGLSGWLQSALQRTDFEVTAQSALTLAVAVQAVVCLLALVARGQIESQAEADIPAGTLQLTRAAAVALLPLLGIVAGATAILSASNQVGVALLYLLASVGLVCVILFLPGRRDTTSRLKGPELHRRAEFVELSVALSNAETERDYLLRAAEAQIEEVRGELRQSYLALLQVGIRNGLYTDRDVDELLEAMPSVGDPEWLTDLVGMY